MLVNTNHNSNIKFFNPENIVINKDIFQVQELEDLEIFELFMDDLVEIDTVFDNVLEKARNSGLDPLSFCDMVQQKLESEKSINETQLTNIKKLTQHIQNSVEGEKSFQVLVEKIKDESPDLEDYFKQNIDNLKLFLSRKHKEMLALPNNTATEKQEEFRHIKRTFRDFFLALAKNKNIKKSYDRILKTSFGRQDSSNGFTCFFTIDWDKGTKGIPVDSMMIFMDELVNFRKNYLCRYSADKVKRVIEEKIKQIKFNLFDTESISSHTKYMLEETKNKSITISDESLYLLKTTFIHGTHSAILPNLPLSDMKLIPISHLILKGIIPLSGELSEGAVLDERSMKHSEISATTLDDGLRPMDYADSFHSNVDLEKRYLTAFLKIIKKEDLKNYSSISSTEDWARFAMAILRVRLMDEQFFHEHKEELSVGLENLRRDFEFFKTTPTYKEYMPKKLDLDGTLGYKYHDEYHYYFINKCEMHLDSLKKALTQPLKTIEKVKDVKTPFPIIFGSTNIHTKWESLQHNLERRTQKFCQLGKDIDFLSVNGENIDELYTYLEKHGLEEKVKIVDNETLKQAVLLNQLASHYFIDFASRKKLAKIFGEESIDIVDIDQVQHTLSQKFWNTCTVFTSQIWDQ